MMRIVIDMQGAQSESRLRGIGRYSMSFAKSIVENSGEHEVFLVLNGLFKDTIKPIRSEFSGILSSDHIRVWCFEGDTSSINPENQLNNEIAELLRESFISSLEPDLVHITSLFEGYGDNSVLSIGKLDQETPVSVSFYDLIPFLNKRKYLDNNPIYSDFYYRQVEYLKKASICLAISDAAMYEGVDNLEIPNGLYTNVSTAADDYFVANNEASLSAIPSLEKKVTAPYILYTGGGDERKNLIRLITAFASLPNHIKDRYQLVFAGHIPNALVDEYYQFASSLGLNSKSFINLGYVTDEELLLLYQNCSLFVFPSWHEGFGLPPLEAMKCGAVVIGSNCSSIPEVIGFEDALFDPYDVSSISQKIEQGLLDDEFRKSFMEHSKEKINEFSWKITGLKAIKAWEELIEKRKDLNSEIGLTQYTHDALLVNIATCIKDSTHGDTLMSLSKCITQNRLSGIKRQLFLDVSEICHGDAATGVQRVVKNHLVQLLKSPPKGFVVEPVYATRTQGYRYARDFIRKFEEGIYSYTDLPDTEIDWIRGDVFFALDMQHDVQLLHTSFYEELRRSGVIVKFLVHDLLPIELEDYFESNELSDKHRSLMRVIASMDGAICVSNATANAFSQWASEQEIKLSSNFQLSSVHNGAEIDSASYSTGIPKASNSILKKLRNRVTFLCVSTIEPRKGQEQIFEAVKILWKQGEDVNLVFVGRKGWKTEALIEKIRKSSEYKKRLFWFDGISDEYLNLIYEESSCLVAASINEGFGLPLIEAAHKSLPLIVRDIPVFKEVAGEHALYFTGTHASDLSEVMLNWLELYHKSEHPNSEKINWLTWRDSTSQLKSELVGSSNSRRQLLVDVSELVHRDARTGIQRVVRNILAELLTNSPADYDVLPVYGTVEEGYKYARDFTLSFMGSDDAPIIEGLIEYAPGDIFFGLDLQPSVQISNQQNYREMMDIGVQVGFLVYDLLPITMPQYFPVGNKEGFEQWFRVIAQCNFAVCISKSTKNDLKNWMSKNNLPPIRLEWFHLGADLPEVNSSVRNFTNEESDLLEKFKSKNSFLMVGTIEPRKGHEQTIDAFEKLWEANFDVNLVIVGKVGWKADKLIKRIENHKGLNKKLYWLNSIDDDFLEEVYRSCVCLVSASYGEGFGLPLIEAAHYGLHVIARDIPVFKEVAGDYAYFFQDTHSEKVLTDAIKGWLVLFESKKHPENSNMSWLSWSESSRDLRRALLCK